jgi:cytochrome c oxidase subunit 2
VQSALAPASPAAESHFTLALVMTIGATLIFLGVAILASWALFAPHAWRGWLASRRAVIAGGFVFPAIVLSALLVWGLLLTRAASTVGEEPRLRIEIIGEQFWWRVRYLDRQGRAEFSSANEIRIPTGEPVRLVLKSADVIHSFWVPSLAGKLDMLPGRTNVLDIRAERAGVYRGQCAEYCGAQHTRMALLVVAQPPEEFARWRAAEREPAARSEIPFLARGRELFVRAGCGACHTVRGIAADGELGPDLTHVGGRRTIGAGQFPTNVGTLAGWISSSQHLKPGNRMPSFDVFTGEELRALAAYLESLK